VKAGPKKRKKGEQKKKGDRPHHLRHRPRIPGHSVFVKMERSRRELSWKTDFGKRREEEEE